MSATTSLFPPAPAWADESTIVDTTPREVDEDGTVSCFGYISYERLVASFSASADQNGPGNGTLPKSDLNVGIGTVHSDGGDEDDEYATGVFIGLGWGGTDFYFDAETARKAAAALLDAADVLEEAAK